MYFQQKCKKQISKKCKIRLDVYTIEFFIENNVTGLYHLHSKQKLSKLTLLELFKEVFEKNDIEIIPDEEVVLDRTIISTRTDFCYTPPGYRKMLNELKEWMSK